MDRILKMKKKADGEAKSKKSEKHPFLVVLFSVFVALLVWFYVQDAEAPDYKKTFTSVPVQMQSLSSVFSVIEGGENRVDITLIGKRSDLNKIKASDLEAYLDLSFVMQPGTYDSEIGVLLPEGTELFDCFPKKATFFVDQTVSVSVPLQVELGSYEAPESVGVDAIPAVTQINVKGPESILDQIHHAKILTGNLGQISSSFERNLEYALYSENGTLIESRHILFPERSVKVEFSVYKTKSVPLTVQSLNGWWKKENMKITVSPETVLIKGEPALVDAVSSVPALILDETKLDSNRFAQTLTPSQIVLPQGIYLAEMLGDINVNLTLTDNGARTLKMNLNSNHVAVTPPKGDLTYTFDEEALSFKIRGSFETIYDADPNDFYLNIDLSELATPGKIEVPVQIVQTSATQGKYYPVGEYTVSVTVQ